MLSSQQRAEIHDLLIEEVDYATATQLCHAIVEIMEQEE